jgi:predicted PurR-regulated permease PerM
MAIGTYAELQTAVANWLDRGDLTERIKEFIGLAEARMNRVLRLQLMVNIDTTTLGGAAALVAGTRDYALALWLPTDGRFRL